MTGDQVDIGEGVQVHGFHSCDGTSRAESPRRPREGIIVDELSEDATGALYLKFYCYTGLRGKVPGGPEEPAEQAWMDSEKGDRTALLSTLARTRELFA